MRKNQAASGVSMLGLQDLHSKGKKYQGCFWTSEARPVVNSWDACYCQLKSHYSI